MKRPAYSLTLLLMVALLSSCVEEFTPTPTGPPAIPSAEQFAIPSDLMTRIQLTDPDEPLQSSWLHAGLHLFTWHSSITRDTQLPLAALKAASKVQPQRINSRTYRWVFLFESSEELDGKRYSMKLEATYGREGQEVIWKLSQNGGGEWVKGTTSLDASEGTFFVLTGKDQPKTSYRISYFQEESARKIRYTRLSDSELERERYVEFEIQQDTEFDRAFALQGSPKHAGNLIEVEWNSVSMEGRVRDAIHFQNYRWHSWDEKQRDVPSAMDASLLLSKW